MRVAIYARVSSEAQAARGTIGSQLEVLVSRTASEGHEVVATYTDDGYSGARLDRPGLDAMRDAAEGGAFDAVWCLSPDRLARSFPYQVLIIDELSRLGVPVIFTDSPPIDDDPQARLAHPDARRDRRVRTGEDRGAPPAGQAVSGASRRGHLLEGALRVSAGRPLRHRPGPPRGLRARSRRHPADLRRVHLGNLAAPDHPPPLRRRRPDRHRQGGVGQLDAQRAAPEPHLQGQGRLVSPRVPALTRRPPPAADTARRRMGRGRRARHRQRRPLRCRRGDRPRQLGFLTPQDHTRTVAAARPGRVRALRGEGPRPADALIQREHQPLLLLLEPRRHQGRRSGQTLRRASHPRRRPRRLRLRRAPSRARPPRRAPRRRRGTRWATTTRRRRHPHRPARQAHPPRRRGRSRTPAHRRSLPGRPHHLGRAPPACQRTGRPASQTRSRARRTHRTPPRPRQPEPTPPASRRLRRKGHSRPRKTRLRRSPTSPAPRRRTGPGHRLASRDQPAHPTRHRTD